MNKALGTLIAVFDGNSWWMPDTLLKLVDYMLLNGKKAVTGYVHPSDENAELNPYVVLQQLEYSQGLGISRCAQSLGNNVLVVSGAIGLNDADVLRGILNEKNIHSVTEDLEITLEMHERGAGVGYVSIANGLRFAPLSFDVLWSQRLRWFIGWLHNTLSIHRDLLLKKFWLTLLFYTPFYPILRLINIVARLTSSAKYFWVTMATGIVRRRADFKITFLIVCCKTVFMFGLEL